VERGGRRGRVGGGPLMPPLIRTARKRGRGGGREGPGEIDLCFFFLLAFWRKRGGPDPYPDA